MKLFGFDVVVKDLGQSKDSALVIGDWSSYICDATLLERKQLQKLIDGHVGALTLDALKDYAKRCGLIVNIGEK